MSENKAAAQTAKNKTEQAAKPAEDEVYFTVLGQLSGELVKIGGMLCGAGAKGSLSKSKADKLQAAGFVKITGIKL